VIKIIGYMFKFFWTTLLALWIGSAFAIPNPQYALDLRAKAPEAWAVEVKEVKRLGNESEQSKANCAARPRNCLKPSDWHTEPVQITVVVKSVERSAAGVKPGDELCVAYTTHNPDFKGQMMVGAQYAQMMAYKVWLVAPAPTHLTAGGCYGLAAEWASIWKV
jgi:hypothetical protein